MNRLAGAALAILMTLYATAAHADVITDWNQNTLEVLKVANFAGNPWSRAMAMVHTAMSDAVNSVQPRYTRYAAAAPVTQAGVVPPAVGPSVLPFALGMLQWRNSRPRRVGSALGRSRQGIPSSSATGAWAISFVAGPVF